MTLPVNHNSVGPDGEFLRSAGAGMAIVVKPSAIIGGGATQVYTANAASTANQATRSGLAQTIDSVALNTVGMKVLLKNQSTASQNGLWMIQSSSWTKIAQPEVVFVKAGTVGGRLAYLLTSANVYSAMGAVYLA